ncbi:MAG: acyltransferase [Verrucomicrobiales bacterium]|nr:acyltransferase [Verrucomicrobiales bacterium]MCP5525604.1 acyltransferase [Verrucomicrobiales bacterium]
MMSGDSTPSNATRPAGAGRRRRFLERLGFYHLACRCRSAWQAFPLRATNFVFQRVVGLNRGCRWPVHFTSTVTTPERLEVHPSARASFALSGGCYIQGINGIIIEENTLFAPGVKLISANHNRDDHRRWDPAPPIRIGPGCWIGANAVILPGVELGAGVVVAAGAVVSKSVPAGQVVGGIPARPLRRGGPEGGAPVAKPATGRSAG